MPGPYTIRRNELAEQYRWKAENIVRFFDKLGMTTKEKVTFLSQELAGAYMLAEDHQRGIGLLRRASRVSESGGRTK